MLLYRTAGGPVVAKDGQLYAVPFAWDELVNDSSLTATLASIVGSEKPDDSLRAAISRPLAPIGNQEVWAAGVTYFRSRTARMDEARNAGGGNFYDRVYAAERPELFFKASPDRVVAPGQALHLRHDSRWIVPEPELTLVVTRDAKIVGYTIGNDLSCRDIEGENPLYLPQAKTFDRCAAVGPVILVSPTQPPAETEIRLVISRNGAPIVDDKTTLSRMKRTPEELVGFLFRDNSHAAGCLLMTGTGIVPDDDFTLQAGDIVAITIAGIGTLTNPVK